MSINKFDADYLALALDIMERGQDIPDRTGTGTRSLFGQQLRFDLTQGFPLLTSKRVHRKSLIHELLWFLRGDTNLSYLHEHGVTIWNEWADENGDLGPVYGKQWRSWPNIKLDGAWLSSVETIDQIANVVKSLSTNPHGRRHIVTAWNPAEVDAMALPPCHCLFQFYVRRLTPAERDAWDVANNNWDATQTPIYYLDCQLYQRSADLFLGVPFNIASYSLLIHMVAQQVNMVPGEFVHTFGDVHIYRNHFDQVREQVSRLPQAAPPPQLLLTKAPSLFEYRYEDFQFANYNPLPAISAPISV